MAPTCSIIEYSSRVGVQLKELTTAASSLATPPPPPPSWRFPPPPLTTWHHVRRLRNDTLRTAFVQLKPVSQSAGQEAGGRTCPSSGRSKLPTCSSSTGSTRTDGQRR